ncbi:unnamed protein product [Prunus armeniaca]
MRQGCDDYLDFWSSQENGLMAAEMLAVAPEKFSAKRRGVIAKGRGRWLVGKLATAMRRGVLMVAERFPATKRSWFLLGSWVLIYIR